MSHVCVCPPVAEVVQAVGGAAEDTGLYQPDADHGARPALAP